MKMKVAGGIGFCAIIYLLTSCASSYTLIHPQIVYYTDVSIADSVSFAYRYDVLSESNNWKYAKKERRENLKVLVIKIVNNSKTTLGFKDNIQLYSGEKQITLLDNKDVYDELKQSVPSFILYLLLTPIHKLSVNFDGPANIFPVGYIVGPVLTGYNVVKATHANAQFSYELIKYNIVNQKIAPDDTVYGIICFEAHDNVPLTMKRKNP